MARAGKVALAAGNSAAGVPHTRGWWPRTVDQALVVLVVAFEAHTVEVMREATEVEERTIQRVLGRLVDLGLIRKKERMTGLGRRCEWLSTGVQNYRWQSLIRRCFVVLRRASRKE